MAVVARVVAFIVGCAVWLAVSNAISQPLAGAAQQLATGVIAAVGAFVVTWLFARWDKLRLCDVGANVGINGPGYAHAQTGSTGDFGVFASVSATAGSALPAIAVINADAGAQIMRSSAILSDGPERPGLALVTLIFSCACSPIGGFACAGSFSFEEHTVLITRFSTTCSLSHPAP